MKNSKQLPLRIILATAGMLMCALSIGCLRQSGFGVDPFQCMVNGLDNVVPLSYGTVNMLTNVVLFIPMILIYRRYIGVSTCVFLFLLGYTVEFFEWALVAIFGAPVLIGKILYLAAAVVLACLAAALYYTANLGVSTYDAISMHIADCKPKLFGRVVPFRAIRIVSDLICTGTGVLLGATAGLGTVITALFMGPLITFFRNTLTDPLLARYANKNQAN